jgi:hypothetical protein
MSSFPCYLVMNYHHVMVSQVPLMRPMLLAMLWSLKLIWMVDSPLDC